MTEAKLKPCPICGSSVSVERVPLKHYKGCVTFEIKCLNCGCERTLMKNDSVYRTEEEARANAIAQWNERPSTVDERWYSAEKHLPKTFHRKTIGSCVYYDSDPVAVVAEDDLGERVYGIGTYYVGVEDGKTVGGWDGVTIEDVGLYACTVTHWMPLPKLPEEEK